MHALADVDQAILVAAREPEELELVAGLGRIRNQFLGWLGVGCGRESAHRGEGLEVAEAEVQRLPATHRKSGQGPVLAVRLDAETRLDGRDHVVDQVALERGEGRPGGIDIALGAVVRLGPPVGHDHQHRQRLLVGDQVVEQGVDAGNVLPLTLVAADPVQQVEDRVLLRLVITGGRVDLHAALRADCLRVVFHRLEFAVGDAFASVLEPGRRGVDGGLVVVAQHDRPPEGSPRARRQAPAVRPRRCGGLRRGVRIHLGRLRLLLGQVADLAGEADAIGLDFAGVADGDVPALEVQGLDEPDGVAVDLGFLQLDLAALAVGLGGGLAGQLVAFGLEGELIRLHADPGIELGAPFSRNLERGRGRRQQDQECAGQQTVGSFHGG